MVAHKAFVDRRSLEIEILYAREAHAQVASRHPPRRSALPHIEEPIVYDNLDGCARLAAALKTPIQLGENFYGPREMHKAIQKGACDLVMPDFMRIRGVTGWMRAAALAGAAGIPMSTHLYPEVAAHMLRVAEMAHWLEWQDRSIRS